MSEPTPLNHQIRASDNRSQANQGHARIDDFRRIIVGSHLG